MANGGDFFLQFGSDAEPFSQNLVKQLGPSIKAIRELITAVDTYDAAASKQKSNKNSPLGSILTTIDEAGARFQTLTGQLGSAMSEALKGITLLRTDLSLLVDEINKLPTASARNTHNGRNKVNVAALGVTEQDMEAAKSVTQRQGKALNQILEGNSVAARNALKRVADINSTVARNAGQAADALMKLGEQIRGLTTKTSASTKGVQQGSFQQNVIVVQGGATVAAPGGTQALDIATLLDRAGVRATTPAAEDARVEQQREKNARFLSQNDLANPAAPGRYYMQGPNGEQNRNRGTRRGVGFQINPDETFQGYFDRQKANQRAEADIAQEIQRRSEARSGIQSATLFGTTQAAFGNRAITEQIEPKLREAFTAPGSVSGGDLQTALARFSLIAPAHGVGTEGIARLPEVLDDYKKRLTDSDELRRAHVQRALAANPNETFAGASQETQRIVAQIDAGRDDTGSRLRAAQRAQAEEADVNRRAQSGARYDLEAAGRMGVKGVGGYTVGTSEEAKERSRQQQAEIKEAASSEVVQAKVAAAKTQLAALREEHQGDVTLYRGIGARVSGYQAPSEGTSFSTSPFIAQEYARKKAGPGGEQEILQTSIPKRELAKYSTGIADAYLLPPEAFQGAGRRISTVASGAEEVGNFGPAMADIRREFSGLAQNAHIAGLSQSDSDTLAGLQAARAEGGGGGRRPPTPPSPAAAADEPEEPQAATAKARARRAAVTRGQAALPADAVAGVVARLTEETQAILRDTKAWLENEGARATAEERAGKVTAAGAALKADPFYQGGGFKGAGGGLTGAKGVFGSALGLTQDAVGRRLVTDVLTDAPTGRANALNAAMAQLKGAAPVVTGGPAADAGFAALKARAQGSDAVYRALLHEVAAQETLNKLRASGTATTAQLARAEAQLIQASSNVVRTQATENPATLQQKLFGAKGFAAGQLRHLGSGLENIVGYQLVFTGFEKLRELVTEGTQADAAFVRLEASLKANGEKAGGLRTALTGIASGTASSLTDVSHAAADLVGVFHNVSDLAFGTKIAAQLANISQGSLTATQAATALRDVIDAYGLSGTKSVQAVGDQIASLSQKTGVPIGDITEATAKLAPEAKEFGLSERQASTLAAYTIQATGQSGESSAEQVSRILATVNTGAAQKALVQAGVATDAQYAKGDTAGVITNLMSKFDQLPPATQRTISSLLGAGRQAATFAALMQNGATAVAEMTGKLNNQGALARQNAAFLNTFAGTVKQVTEDFKQLGVTLVRLGAFDAIAILAKSMDLLFKAFNETFGRIADILDKTPLTKGLLHITVVLLEAAAAFKLFGGAAAAAFGKMGIGKAINTTESLAASAAVRAGVVGAEEVPLRYAPFTGRGAVGGLARLPQRALVDAPRAAYSRIRGPLANTALDRELQRGGQMSLFGGHGPAAAGVRPAMLAGEAEQMTLFGGPAASGAVAGAEASVGRATQAFRNFTGAAGSTNTALTRARAGIGGVGTALLGLAAAGYLISTVIGKNSADAKAAKNELDLLTGKAGDNKAGPATTANQDATDANLKQARSTGGFLNVAVRNSLGIAQSSAGNLSPISEGLESELRVKTFATLKAAIQSKDPAKIVAAQAAVNAEIVKQTDDIVHAHGLNDKAAQTQAAADLLQLQTTLNDVALAHLQVASGFAALTITEVENVAKMQAAFGPLNAQTRKTFAAVNASVLAAVDIGSLDSGVAKALTEEATGQHVVTPAVQAVAARAAVAATAGQAATKGHFVGGIHGQFVPGTAATAGTPAQAAVAGIAGAAAVTRDATYAEQLANAVTTSQEATKSAGKAFENITKNKDPKLNLTPGNAQYDRTLAAILTGQTATQAATDAQNQYGVALGQSQTTAAKAQGNNNAGVIAGLQKTEAGWRTLLGTVQADDPKYNEYLAGIADAKAALAQAQAQPLLDALAIESAGTISPEKQHILASEAAARQLAADFTGGTPGTAGYGVQIATNEQLKQDKIAAASAGVTSIQDAQAHTQAAYDVLVAVDATTGDSVKAATDAYDKTNQAYNFAVANYGKDSTEARQAYAAKITAGLSVFQATVADQNSKLQLAETLLTTRGGIGSLTFDKKTGQFSGQTDIGKAAADKITEAQNAIASFHKAGGKDNTVQGRQLAGQLADAQRSAFDQQLNDQLGLLDFQKETYAITSAQEVSSLQQILKNKQLTLQEQRDITLKIKNMQQAIREQLTGSGFNIPSNIKLPSAYEVRRSLGAGFGGASSSASIVNNSAHSTSNVVINNNVPSAAVAASIAAQVLNMINQNTNTAVRATSSTPRLVPTR